MATSTGKICCVQCGKDKATLRCGGCLREFCYNHMEGHRQELDKQLDEIEVNRDLFRQTLTEQLENPKTHALMKQIDQWEYNSIKKIQQTAEEIRQDLLTNVNIHIHQAETDLNKLTGQLRESRQEHDFNEIGLRQFQEELKRLTDKLAQSSNISIREDFTPFISKICINMPGNSSRIYDSTISSTLLPPVIQSDPELVKLFKSINDLNAAVSNNEIIAYIHKYMYPSKQYYIRNIVLSYLDACFIDHDSRKKIQENIAKKRMPVLIAIINHNLEAEIQAVYAIQNFVSKLEHPPKMARLLFDIFYDNECISEDAFFEWLNNPDLSESEGHAVVEMSTKDFFAWLQQAETKVEEGEEFWN